MRRRRPIAKPIYGYRVEEGHSPAQLHDSFFGRPTVQFKRLHDGARLPRNAYGNDAGWDLFVIEHYMVEPGTGVDMRTGIAVALPEGYYGRIVARSSTMRKRGLMVLEGIIDAGFRGELFSYVYHPAGDMRNLGADWSGGRIHVSAGESVAQLIVQKVEPVTFQEVDELPESQRGEKGFGSSGN
jgi:dUTP pyrophosphatase